MKPKKLTILKAKNLKEAVKVVEKIGPHFFQMIKDSIAYKGVTYLGKVRRGDLAWAIAKLLIPEGTIVYVTKDKCRAQKAIVLEMKKGGRKEKLVSCFSHYMGAKFEYRVGKTMEPVHNFSYSFEECDSGIHLFPTLAKTKAFIY